MHMILSKDLCVLQKVKDKRRCFRRAICRTPWSFLIKQGVLLLHLSDVLGMYWGVHVRSHASDGEAWFRTLF